MKYKITAGVLILFMIVIIMFIVIPSNIQWANCVYGWNLEYIDGVILFSIGCIIGVGLYLLEKWILRRIDRS